MKIVLIQPAAHQETPDYVNEPLGLGYLAAVLIEAGFEDVHIRTALFDDVEETIRLAGTARLVGLTATSPMLKSALYLAGRIKEAAPETVIALGGAHATALPGVTIQHPDIDLVVRGEGEATFRELAEALSRGRPRYDLIRGLTYLDGGSVTHTPDRPLLENLDEMPFPARHLYKLEQFLTRGKALFGDSGSWVFSSRGCPYRCTYCASGALWTRKWRPRSPGNVMQEIELLVRDYGVDRINFADDTFTVSAKRVSEFCSLLRSRGLELGWGCNLRVDTVDRGLLMEMAASGCTDVWIGAESGSSRILKNLKKVITPDQIAQVFAWAAEAGLRRRGYFMIGSPEEDLETIAETGRLIDRVQPDSISISIFTPYPGCEAYQAAVEEGFDPRRLDWSQIDLYSRVLLPTRHLSREGVKREHTRLLDHYGSIISTRGKTRKSFDDIKTFSSNILVFGSAESDHWNEYLHRLPSALNDVYLSPEYGDVFQREGYGESQCFVYREGEHFFIYPYLKRRIDSVAGREPGADCYDIETPYGYGGPVATSIDRDFIHRAHQAFTAFCRSTNVVCEFVRFHPLVESERYSVKEMQVSYNRQTVYIDVSRDEDTIWTSHYSGTGRNMIRKAVKSGVTVEETRSLDDLHAFVDIYRQTMSRLSADRFYFFPASFFENMRRFLAERFQLLVARKDGETVAGAVFLRNDRYVHYHLAGSRRDCQRYAPNNLLLHHAVLSAIEGPQEKMHIGGGSSTSRKDSLFRFKTNFSPLRCRYCIGSRVHLPELYGHLKRIWQAENPDRAEALGEVLQIYRF